MSVFYLEKPQCVKFTVQLEMRKNVRLMWQEHYIVVSDFEILKMFIKFSFRLL